MSDEPLQGMSWDQRQELKEAVCDAVLDRTRRVVTGEGSHGAALLEYFPAASSFRGSTRTAMTN